MSPPPPTHTFDSDGGSRNNDGGKDSAVVMTMGGSAGRGYTSYDDWWSVRVRGGVKENACDTMVVCVDWRMARGAVVESMDEKG